MSKTKGMKCGPCDKATDIIGGYFWCRYCETYIKDPITKEAIRYE